MHNNTHHHHHYSEKISVFLSLLCAVHCIITPILMVLLPVASIYFEKYHWVEYVIFSSVFFLGTSAILHGYKYHHKNKVPAFIFIFGLMLLCTSSALRLLFDVNDVSVHFLSAIGGIACGLGQLYNLKLIN